MCVEVAIFEGRFPLILLLRKILVNNSENINKMPPPQTPQNSQQTNTQMTRNRLDEIYESFNRRLLFSFYSQ